MRTYGTTTFFGAAAYGHSDVTKQLLAASCDVDLRSEMGTVLEVAQRQGHIGITIAGLHLEIGRAR